MNIKDTILVKVKDSDSQTPFLEVISFLVNDEVLNRLNPLGIKSVAGLPIKKYDIKNNRMNLYFDIKLMHPIQLTTCINILKDFLDIEDPNIKAEDIWTNVDWVK